MKVAISGEIAVSQPDDVDVNEVIVRPIRQAMYALGDTMTQI